MNDGVTAYPDQFALWRPGWIVFEPDRPSMCYSVPAVLQLAVAASTADTAIMKARFCK